MKNIYKDFPAGWKKNSRAGLALISETKDLKCRICGDNVGFMESSQSPSGGEYFICLNCASKIKDRY
jgi:hypothetical protein